MKRTRPNILIIGLTFFFSLLSTSGQSATYYRCVNSQGSVMLTDNVPSDPDFKCTLSAFHKDPTPQERAVQTDAYRQQEEAGEYYKARRDAPIEVQTGQNSNQVEMEKKRLQAQIKQNEEKIRVIRRSTRSGRDIEITFFENGIKRKKEDLILLESDPEQYFYQKEVSQTNPPKRAERSTDTKSRNDFLPKVGKYRWQVE